MLAAVIAADTEAAMKVKKKPSILMSNDTAVAVSGNSHAQIQNGYGQQTQAKNNMPGQTNNINSHNVVQVNPVQCEAGRTLNGVPNTGNQLPPAQTNSGTTIVGDSQRSATLPTAQNETQKLSNPSKLPPIQNQYRRRPISARLRKLSIAQALTPNLDKTFRHLHAIGSAITDEPLDLSGVPGIPKVNKKSIDINIQIANNTYGDQGKKVQDNSKPDSVKVIEVVPSKLSEIQARNVSSSITSTADTELNKITVVNSSDAMELAKMTVVDKSTDDTEPAKMTVVNESTDEAELTKIMIVKPVIPDEENK